MHKQGVGLNGDRETTPQGLRGSGPGLRCSLQEPLGILGEAAISRSLGAAGRGSWGPTVAPISRAGSQYLLRRKGAARLGPGPWESGHWGCRSMTGDPLLQALRAEAVK